MQKVRNLFLPGLIIFMAAIAFFALGLSVGGYFGHQLATVTIETEEVDLAEGEYYRGIYDFCLQQMRTVKPCHKIVQTVTDARWYEKPSTGWTWPPTAKQSVAQSQR